MRTIRDFLSDVAAVLTKTHLGSMQRAILLRVYIVLRVKRFLLGRVPFVQGTVHALPKYRICSPNFNDFYWTFKEVFIDDDYYFKTSNPEPFIVNLGANIGVDELYFKWLYPNCSILAFEAEPSNARALTDNIARNQIEGVTIETKAVGGQVGEMKLFGSKRAASLQSSLVATHEHVDEADGVTVPVVTLDSYIKDKAVTLLKIDIEGAEAQVITQLAAAQCLQNIDQIVIEFHHFGDSSNKLSDILAALETQFDVTFKCDYRGLAALPHKHTYYFMLYARNKSIVN